MKQHQLDLTQAVTQLDVKKGIPVLMDKNYEKFFPKLAARCLGRPWRLNKCIMYSAEKILSLN